MIGRRQPWAFDGGGDGGGHAVARPPSTPRLRQKGSCSRKRALGISLVWMVFVLVQMRITEAKIGNYILNISLNYHSNN